MPVTKVAAHELTSLRDRWKDIPDTNYLLNVEEAVELVRVMKELDVTLSAESGLNIAFIVTEKKIDVKKLLNDVPSLFSPSVFKFLPVIAKHDFQESGKCIAFGLPTAAAFHLMRGTEDTLRQFYCNIVKRNRLEILLWGPMIKQLKSRKQPPPKELLQNLDNIKNSFRNPTQHPDKIYNVEEVQDLFHLCVDVVNRMISYLKKLLIDKESKSK